MKYLFKNTNFELNASKLIWFDGDSYIVKVLEVVVDLNLEELKLRGLSEPGIFISHDPFRSELDYFVGSSYFRDLGIRPVSAMQAKVFDSCLKALNEKCDLPSTAPLIKTITVQTSKQFTNLEHADYIDSLIFDFDGVEPEVTVSNC